MHTSTPVSAPSTHPRTITHRSGCNQTSLNPVGLSESIASVEWPAGLLIRPAPRPSAACTARRHHCRSRTLAARHTHATRSHTLTHAARTGRIRHARTRTHTHARVNTRTHSPSPNRMGRTCTCTCTGVGVGVRPSSHPSHTRALRSTSSGLPPAPRCPSRSTTPHGCPSSCVSRRASRVPPMPCCRPQTAKSARCCSAWACLPRRRSRPTVGSAGTRGGGAAA